jgi:hypothetical protein
MSGNRIALLVSVLFLMLVAYTGGRLFAYHHRPENCTPQAGSRWTGADRDDYNHDEPQPWAEMFADYPLYWLGPRFAGYNLQYIDHRPPPDNREYVRFDYGRPYYRRPVTDLFCREPLYVAVWPGCLPSQRPPDRELRGVRGEAVVQIWERPGQPGVLGGLRFLTGPVTINVAGEAPIPIERVIEGLRGIGATGSVEPGDPLPPPVQPGC